MPYIGNIVQDFSVSTAMLNSDSVTSIKVLDGTLVNADINDSAAIAVSKLANFVTSNADNRLITGSGTVNTLNGESELTYSSPQLKLLSTSTAPQIRINSAADDAAATRFTFGRATAANNFVNGAVAGDSVITFGTNLLFGVQTAEKMRITSSGSVGINITNPPSPLSIKGTGQLISLVKSANTNNNGILFQDSTPSNKAAIWHYGSDDALVFWSGGSTERMRINSSGRVGIGTTSPSAALEVINSSTGRSYTVSSSTELVVERNGNSQISIIAANNSDSILHFGDTDDENVGLIGYDHDNNSMRFRTSGTERTRIDSSGRVGIGTTSPKGLLHIHNSAGARNDFSTSADALIIEKGGNTGISIDPGSSGTANIFFPNESNHSIASIGHNNSTGEFRLRAEDHMIFAVNANTERARINSSGDLCVGTTTAVGKAEIATSASEIGLTVSNDTHDSTLQILATAANKNSNIFFGDNADGNVGAIDYDHNNNSLAFKVSGAEKARFDNSGDFSIGSSTINLQSTNRTVLNVNGQTSTALCLNSNDTITGFLFADSGEFRIQAEAGAGNLVKIRNNNGTICHFDDDGIKFNGDTAAANALDDYEEGTFTPSISSGLSAGQIAFNSRSGKYTKVGNLVTFTFHMNISSATLDSGDLKFGGLPFTSVNNSNLTGGMSIMLNTGNISSTDNYRVVNNSTDVLVITAAGDPRAANATTINAGNRICSYFGFYYVS